jgi:hypothetical protein
MLPLKHRPRVRKRHNFLAPLGPGAHGSIASLAPTSAGRLLHLEQRTSNLTRKRAKAQKRAPYAAASCPGVEWRATVDEDGQYCFAVAL